MKPVLLSLPWGVRTSSIWLLSSLPPPAPLHLSTAGPPGLCLCWALCLPPLYRLPLNHPRCSLASLPATTHPRTPQCLLHPCLNSSPLPLSSAYPWLTHGIGSGQGVRCWLHEICTQTLLQVSPAGLTSLTAPESRLDHLPPSQVSLPATSWVTSVNCSREGAERCLLVLLSCVRFPSPHHLGAKGGLGWHLRETEGFL